jgi:hypothetical protein
LAEHLNGFCQGPSIFRRQELHFGNRDRFSKYGHFLPMSHPFTALTVAKSFLTNVYRLHGLPTSIVSDRDRMFTSQFWQELFRLASVTLKMSSAYHP